MKSAVGCIMVGRNHGVRRGLTPGLETSMSQSPLPLADSWMANGGSLTGIAPVLSVVPDLDEVSCVTEPGAGSRERRAAHRRRLIEAGASLFGSRDAASVRIDEICAKAGVTEQVFHELFADVEALFTEVVARTMETIKRDVGIAVSQAPNDRFARISTALRTAVESIARNPQAIHLLITRPRGVAGGVVRRQGMANNAEILLEWLGFRYGAFGRESVEARMKAVAIVGAAEELLVSWADGVLDTTPSELADFLVGLYWRANLP